MAQIVQRTLVKDESAEFARGAAPSAVAGLQLDGFVRPEEKLPNLFIARSQSPSLD
jgi:hypothetical protein